MNTAKASLKNYNVYGANCTTVCRDVLQKLLGLRTSQGHRAWRQLLYRFCFAMYRSRSLCFDTGSESCGGFHARSIYRRIPGRLSHADQSRNGVGPHPSRWRLSVALLAQCFSNYRRSDPGVWIDCRPGDTREGIVSPLDARRQNEDLNGRMKTLLAICILSAIVFGQQVPETMTKLTVRLQSPGISEESFAAKPKTMYRAGSGYCRTEELPDLDRGIHGLMVVNEPDAWMVNLLTKTAQHFVDPGPTFNCHLPIFHGEQVKSAADMKNSLLDLEFGQELSYFKGKRVTPKQGPVLRDKPTSVYTAEIGDSQLFLFTTGAPERPWAVARHHSNTREIFGTECTRNSRSIPSFSRSQKV